MYIEVEGKIYTFYDHALMRMKERGIALEWVESALLNPDDRSELAPGRLAYDKVLETGQSIRVVVDETASQIVTVYFVETSEE